MRWIDFPVSGSGAIVAGVVGVSGPRRLFFPGVPHAALGHAYGCIRAGHRWPGPVDNSNHHVAGKAMCGPVNVSSSWTSCDVVYMKKNIAS
jgi:hypothetical protein